MRSAYPARAARSPAPLLLLIWLACGACSGVFEPRRVPPGLAVVLGGTATDTIGSALATPLAVVVHDNRGRAPYKSPITFRVLPISGAPAAPAVVGATSYVYPPGPQTAIMEWTDSSGRAAVTVQFGTVPGQVRIAISDTVLPVYDTVSYTILPGQPARIVTAPADSALYVGASYRLATQVLDRAGNVRGDSVIFTVDSSATVASVQPNGTITAGAIGRARLRLALASGSVTTQARVSVLPRGTLAVVLGGYALVPGLARVNLDGSGYRMLTTTARLYSFPSWSPDGANVVFNTAYLDNARLMRVDTLGNMTSIAHAGVMPSETWARYSYDGRYIYYTAGWYPDSLDTYRINADGSGTPVRVTPARPGSTRYWKASPSPNDSLLAYSEAGFAIDLDTLLDGSHFVLSTPGWAEAPRFSPDGAWIAFGEDENHQLHLIRPDGTGFRTLSPAGTWVDSWGLDWSPDGAWLVIRTGGQLQIVRPSDGLLIPLPYARDMYEPTWRQRP